MKIILRDYAGTPIECEVSDDCEYISGVILSGDMVMTEPYHLDTSNCRMMSFYDGEFHVSKNNFGKMNKLTNSYEIQGLD